MSGRLSSIPAITVVALLAMAVAIAGCKSISPDPTATPATEDGMALLEARCSVCHSPDMATMPKMTSDQWDRLVTQMINRGAQLTDNEKQVLVGYLTATYGLRGDTHFLACECSN
jgi:mono/diheme cytochrome c family protein